MQNDSDEAALSFYSDSPSESSKGDKKPSQPWIQRMVCALPPGMADHDIPNCGVIHFIDNELDLELPFEIRQIKLKSTDEEKRKRRRLYTKQYIKRPDVQAKIQARLNDPIKIKQRQDYAKQPEVKERKRALNKRNREIRKLLKDEKPEVYKELLTRVI